MATFISNPIAWNNCYLIICCLRTNNSNLFSSSSLLRKKKLPLFPLRFHFPYIVSSLWGTLNFILSRTSSFVYKGQTFLGWRDLDIKHKASGAAFLRHALTGSLGADLRQVLFSNFLFWGEEGQGENRRARKRLRKSATDSYGAIANCHLPPSWIPVSLQGSGFYRSYKQPPGPRLDL